MPRQRTLFPHLEGAAGARRAAITRRARRVSRNLAQTIADLQWLRVRRPDMEGELTDLIFTLAEARLEGAPTLSQLEQ